MARSFRNGEVPAGWLVEFASGWNSADGAWVHSLPPSTYRKHLALVALAKRNTGRDLKIGVGWCAYRPLWAQVMLKKRFGIMAATPGTSSHGGLWENRQVMAIDYSNWADVYGGDRAAWFRDVRAVGLEPDLISPRRGYPDEPWHVVDLDPWAAVPSGGGASQPEESHPLLKASTKMTIYVLRDDGLIVAIPEGGKTYNFKTPAEYNRLRATIDTINGQREKQGNALITRPPALVGADDVRIVKMTAEKLNDLIHAQGAYS